MLRQWRSSAALRQLSVNLFQISALLPPTVGNRPTRLPSTYANCRASFAQLSVDLNHLSTILIPNINDVSDRTRSAPPVETGTSVRTYAIVAAIGPRWETAPLGPWDRETARPNPPTGCSSLKELGVRAGKTPLCSTRSPRSGRFIPTVGSFTPTVSRLPPTVSIPRKGARTP
jgi:hypothetical protein